MSDTHGAAVRLFDSDPVTGPQLREARRAADIRAEDLAALAGCSPRMVYFTERYAAPRPHQVRRYLTALAAAVMARR